MSRPEPRSRAAVESSLAVPRQARSQIGLEKMLQAGRELIEASGNLDDLSITDIVERSGTSIGAFYRRFDSKDMFFDVVLDRAMTEGRDRIRDLVASGSEWRSGDARAVANAIIEMYVQSFRRNRGLFHASLLRVARPRATWDVVKEANRDVLALIVPPLVAAIIKERGAKKVDAGPIEFEVQAALQLILGMLVNIVLNNPGPLTLTSRRLAPWLKTQFCRCLILATP
ncbi:TetR/AcrR family transcriptional regulator [Caballeronia sp. LjRoot29]|uniref:TetR/AcrR family transcriptional regulator n=1 Tax=Caballeronia sp. LjRoot29 TaxID=3342315 RepID=UPI003ED132E2